MDKNTVSYNYIEEYLLLIRSKGRYTVTQNELLHQFKISPKAINQSVFRLKSKGRIAQIRKQFYAIIPPEYSQQGMLPVYLFVDDLMKNLNRDYYLGLYSAAALHGAGHQQPMESQIIIRNTALRSIKKDKLSIHFFTRNDWNVDIIEKKTDAGYIKVSSPELTALDLIAYHAKIGGINRLLPILEELAEIMKPSKLYKSAQRYNQLTVVQRLGFLLEHIGANVDLVTALRKLYNENTTYKTIPLSIAVKESKGEINSDWKIIINTNLQQ